MDLFSSSQRDGLAVGAKGENVTDPRTSTVTGSEVPLRVFLVEDSRSVRDRLTDFLTEPGIVDVIGFADTETDAVRQLFAGDIDVAIVDSRLRAGTGIGVIESVRSLEPALRPTIVVLTNYAFPEFEAACRERGADYFFDKSSQFGELKDLLHSIMRKRH